MLAPVLQCFLLDAEAADCIVMSRKLHGVIAAGPSAASAILAKGHADGAVVRLGGSHLLRCLGWCLLGAVLCALPVRAQQVQDCSTCHHDVKAASEAHKGIACDNCHSNVESDKHDDAMSDLPAKEMCSNCHLRVQGLMKSGLHKGLECNVCHGTMHEDFAPTNNKACARCHGDTARSLNEGVHGQLWSRGQQGLLCANCHSGHDTTPAKLHPLLVLRDSEGRPVIDGSMPASPSRSCDGCHDVPWIAEHSYHGKFRDGAPNALIPSCFLCHVQDASNSDRLAEIAAGRPAWSETAVLSATGLTRREGDKWEWLPGVLRADGSAPPRALRIQAPGARECGFCHGLVYQSKKPLARDLLGSPKTDVADRYGPSDQTERAGIVFSDQLIRESALKIADKEALQRPWDVHIQRLLTCRNCHVAPNHPAYALVPSSSAKHLMFEPRRLSIGEYLKRPDHRLAPGGPTAQPPEPTHAAASEMRRCGGCHDAPNNHGFLPRPARHLAALECQSCHIPKLYAPARQEIDWTVPLAPERPRITYRGLAQGGSNGEPMLSGYEPLLLLRKSPSGDTKLAPFNAITTWFWVSDTKDGTHRGNGDMLKRALFEGDRYQPDIIRALDGNGDGAVTPDELVLDSQQKVAAIAARLRAAGAENPRIEGKIELVPVNHGVGPSRTATRSCESCHDPRSRITAPFLLSSSAPFGANLQALARSDASLAGALRRDSGGRLTFELATGRKSVYLFGRSSSRAVDWTGLTAVSAAVALAVIHGGLRYKKARERKRMVNGGDGSSK